MNEFTNASESTKRRNPHLFGVPAPASTPKAVVENLRLVICGQIRGGKNNMIVTRTGLHFPKPEWAKWRDEAVRGIKEQLPRNFTAITEPVNVRLEYVAGDHRRRDFPAICDSIWHVMEKAGVVQDDTLLWVAESTREYDKDCPRATLTFL